MVAIFMCLKPFIMEISPFRYVFAMATPHKDYLVLPYVYFVLSFQSRQLAYVSEKCFTVTLVMLLTTYE